MEKILVLIEKIVIVLITILCVVMIGVFSYFQIKLIKTDRQIEELQQSLEETTTEYEILHNEIMQELNEEI
jgi:cell division protein FtsL